MPDGFPPTCPSSMHQLHDITIFLFCMDFNVPIQGTPKGQVACAYNCGGRGHMNKLIFWEWWKIVVVRLIAYRLVEAIGNRDALERTCVGQPIPQQNGSCIFVMLSWKYCVGALLVVIICGWPHLRWLLIYILLIYHCPTHAFWFLILPSSFTL